MKPRHEWKHEIAADCRVLAAQLSAVAQRDAHEQDGRCEIRSLYFDDPWNTELWETASVSWTWGWPWSWTSA